MSIHIILTGLAIVCFFLAAINWPSPQPNPRSVEAVVNKLRINMIGAGLCLWALATIVTA
jgi:hypothetical protein